MKTQVISNLDGILGPWSVRTSCTVDMQMTTLSSRRVGRPVRPHVFVMLRVVPRHRGAVPVRLGEAAVRRHVKAQVPLQGVKGGCACGLAAQRRP